MRRADVERTIEILDALDRHLPCPSGVEWEVLTWPSSWLARWRAGAAGLCVDASVGGAVIVRGTLTDGTVVHGTGQTIEAAASDAMVWVPDYCAGAQRVDRGEGGDAR